MTTYRRHEEPPFYGPNQGVVLRGIGYQKHVLGDDYKATKTQLIPPALEQEIQSWAPLPSDFDETTGELIHTDRFEQACENLFKKGRIFLSTQQMRQVANRLLQQWQSPYASSTRVKTMTLWCPPGPVQWNVKFWYSQGEGRGSMQQYKKELKDLNLDNHPDIRLLRVTQSYKVHCDSDSCEPSTTKSNDEEALQERTNQISNNNDSSHRKVKQEEMTEEEMVTTASVSENRKHSPAINKKRKETSDDEGEQNTEDKNSQTNKNKRRSSNSGIRVKHENNIDDQPSPTPKRKSPFILDADHPCDVVLKCSDGHKIQAHKKVLSKMSTVYQRAFHNNPQLMRISVKFPCSIVNVALLAGYQSEGFHLETELDKDAVKQDLEASFSLASKLKIEAFQKLFHDVLAESLTVNNLKQWLEMSQRSQNLAVKQICLQYVEKNAMKFLRKPTIVALATENPALWKEMLEVSLKQSTT